MRSPLGDFLERYARDRGAELINDDGTVNTAKLAAHLEMNQSHVHRLIAGQTLNPRHETVRHVSAKIGIAESVLLGDQPREPVNTHTLELARKLERLPSADRAVIEALADRFIELLERAEEPTVDTGRFDVLHVEEGTAGRVHQRRHKDTK